MVLESTVVCVDNSDYMRNGDFVPSRLLAQQDAVNLVCHSKTRSNPENNVALITLSNNTEVLATLTSDVTKILSKLHQVKPKGELNFMSGLRIAHLVLKHRQGKNHKMRIIVFIGSPIADNDKEIVKLAKRLRKEKVNVDIVNFGEESLNTEKLTTFVNTMNGTDGNSSRLVTVSPGPLLSDALISSPILAGEAGVGAGAGYEFGIDPNEDPELALALRVSMEEQRAQQEEAARRAGTQGIQETGAPAAVSTEETMLRQVLEMSRQDINTTSGGAPIGTATDAKDFSAMTEEEQIAYAMQMSLQTEMSMDTDSTATMEESGNDDEEEAMMTDPDFLRGVLESLPGVDLENQQVKDAMEEMKKNQDKNKKK